ncbi:transcriptional regulator Kaiso-like isoform X6 [Ylistrum balloti]|uniref:transcriptional regulator Kaiso-like isoform X6 n=1 Tax=Ylistrum balloti TaxID=509963 RepID=UPI002905C45E|nr:transcriptional regulator Kaiso-like isoform X6 [Ylistrum balloti]
MNYQKFYTNGIHSSSLLCQLATMWKSQTLCDAIIKTGSINTKAHRLVLVAACPMLQSMDNASIGSHLEVRLASEIKQDSVNMFLQYLYEGFMMLTEDNHKDIEKIARLLQVDSVIKCCADFCKSLHEKTGLSVYSAGQYKYSSHDMLEFKHVRVSGIQKTVQDSMMKRHSDFQRPNSPGSKRPRMHRPGSPSDGQRGDNMYGHSSHSDSDRVPRLGLGSFPGAAGRNLQPGVVEVIEDSLELVQTEPVERDPVTGRPIDSRPPVQKTVAISVASQVTGGDPDLQIVNVSGVKDGTSSSSSTSRAQLSTATHTTSTPIARDSRGSFMHSSFSSQQSSQSMRSDIPMPSLSRASSDRTMSQMPRSDIQRSMQNQFSSEPQQQQQKQSSSQYPSIPQALIDMDFTAAKQKSDVFPTSLQKATDAFPTNLPKPSDVVFPGMQMSSQQNNTQQSKPFAAGSAGQVNQSVPVHINTSSSSSSPITSLPPVSPVIPDTSFSLSASPNSKSQPSTSRSESVERPGSGERMKEERPPTVDLVGPDISIVKIESTDKDETGALDMYVDTGDDGEVHPHGMEGDGEQTYEGGSDYDVEEPPGEMEGSNEGSNLSGDQNAWYLNTMKGFKDEKTLGSYVIEGMRESASDMSRLSCESCGIYFNSESEKSKHLSLIHGSDLYTHQSTGKNVKSSGLLCKSCGILFNTENEKVLHMGTVHKSNKNKNVVATCNICGKTYKSIWGYRYHQKSHQRSFGKTSGSCQCKICGKFFQSLFYLQRHLKSHSTERPHSCQRCGRSYKHSSGLKMHQASCYKQMYSHTSTWGP